MQNAKLKVQKHTMSGLDTGRNMNKNRSRSRHRQWQTQDKQNAYNDRTSSEGNTETKYTDWWQDEDQVRKTNRCGNEGEEHMREHEGSNTIDRGSQREEHGKKTQENLKDTWGHGKKNIIWTKHEAKTLESWQFDWIVIFTDFGITNLRDWCCAHRKYVLL